VSYVYAIVVDGVLRYIGKGSSKRARVHMRMVRTIARRRAVGETVQTSPFYNRLTEAWLTGSDIQDITIADGLTNDEAFAREAAEIAAAPEGQLWNIWRGGLGSDKGHRLSDEQKRKIADANRKTWSDPTLLAEHSERCKVVLLRPDVRERLRRPKTPEHNAKVSAARKAQWADPAFRAKMAAVHSSEQFREKAKAASDARWAARRKREQSP
jgi:hypothetical protein